MKKYILIIAALVFSNFIFAQQKGMVTIKGTLNGDLKDTIKFICTPEHPMIPQLLWMAIILSYLVAVGI